MIQVPEMKVSIGKVQAQVDAALANWAREHKSARLWQGDASLWTGKDEARWLGWLHIVPQMQKQVASLVRFADGVCKDGFRDVLLLGMGGSSLCPEVLAMTFGSAPGYPGLHVLDSTVPEQVMRFGQGLDLSKTLCLVASKSGTTTEPHAFCAYFWEEMQKAVGKAAGSHFVAITDPGSALEKLAKENGFRQVFEGVPDIGGRFSALSAFGLVPAALIGLDMDDFLWRAAAMADRCGPEVPAGENPGVALGILLGALVRAGRDKVTLATSPKLWDLGAWLEQLLAESTGKEGLGVVPIDREALGAVDVYGDDRAFVYIRLDEAPDAAQDAQIQALRDAGQPVVEIRLDSAMALGAEFFRWEMATAAAGAVLGIHPFDQPNVQESKDFTARLTGAYEKTGQLPSESPIIVDDGVQVFADDATARALGAAEDMDDCLMAHLRSIKPGDYVALCAFLDMRESIVERLQILRHRIRDRYQVATTLGFGPRFLHSTGQLHKGGSNRVVVVQLTSENARDVPIPGRGFSFGILKDAQAIGDAQALISRHRRLVRLHFDMDVEAGLDRLIQVVS